MIINYIKQYLNALMELTFEMAPYLLLGFFIAGLLYVFFPKKRINQFLGKNNFMSVLNAALMGIPLPLCSCGVIPTGVSLYKNGASKGSSVSFLISTPQTGVDSIFATYSLLGLPLAIIRPVIALVTGLLGGLVTNASVKNIPEPKATATEAAPDENRHHTLRRMLNYAFVEFLQDISKWLVIGLLLAALIAVAIPADFFTNVVGNEYLSMLIVLAASIPLYVCATGSVPIAAVLLMKGLSPGAAIVFLMAGPATNAATITVIGKVMGKRTLYAYLSSIIAGALFFGVLVNELLPREWFTGPVSMVMDGHGSHLLPQWLQVGSGVLLVLLIINGYVQRYLGSRKFEKENNTLDAKNINKETMMEKTVTVNGMTCNHCKMNVEKNLNALQGIDKIEVDLQNGKVKLTGENIDLGQVKSTVEGIGYEFAGEA